MAGRQGLEPRYADPESAVLPLDDLPEFQRQYNKRSAGTYCRSAGTRGVLVWPESNGLRRFAEWEVRARAAFDGALIAEVSTASAPDAGNLDDGVIETNLASTINRLGAAPT